MKALTHAHIATRDLLCARLTQQYGALEDALQRLILPPVSLL